MTKTIPPKIKFTFKSSNDIFDSQRNFPYQKSSINGHLKNIWRRFCFINLPSDNVNLKDFLSCTSLIQITTEEVK